MKAIKKRSERRADEQIFSCHANETVLFTVAVVVIFVRGKVERKKYASLDKKRLLELKYWTSKMLSMATKSTIIFAKRLRKKNGINKQSKRSEETWAKKQIPEN